MGSLETLVRAAGAGLKKVRRETVQTIKDKRDFLKEGLSQLKEPACEELDAGDATREEMVRFYETHPELNNPLEGVLKDESLTLKKFTPREADRLGISNPKIANGRSDLE